MINTLLALPEFWLLVLAAPVLMYIAWSDLARMRIPNVAVLTLLAVFVVVGIILFPFGEFTWRLFVQGFGMLVITYILNQLGYMGGGDAKMLAAMAPYFNWVLLPQVLFLLSAGFLAGFALHRLVRYSGLLKNFAPTWVSWEDRRFPAGTSLACSLLVYLFLICYYAVFPLV